MRIEPKPEPERHCTLRELASGDLFSFRESDARRGHGDEVWMKLIDCHDLHLPVGATLIANQEDGMTRILKDADDHDVIRRRATLRLDDMDD